MFRGKHAEAECRPQGAQLLAPCLVARGVIGECPRGNAKLAGNKGECCLRNDLARTQQAPGIAENTELQRETKLVRVAATTLYGRKIGDTQGPVPDQFGFGDRQGKQLLELLAGDGAASRHGQLSQYGAGPEQRQRVAAGQAGRVRLKQRAALYCRVSTADQSCARQKRGLARMWCPPVMRWW